jgi:hypothetical protein
LSGGQRSRFHCASPAVPVQHNRRFEGTRGAVIPPVSRSLGRRSGLARRREGGLRCLDLIWLDRKEGLAEADLASLENLELKRDRHELQRSCRHVRTAFICSWAGASSSRPEIPARRRSPRQRFRSATASPPRSRAACRNERFGTDPGLTTPAPGVPIMPASVGRESTGWDASLRRPRPISSSASSQAPASLRTPRGTRNASVALASGSSRSRCT